MTSDGPSRDAPEHRRATRSVRDLPAAERPRERLALRGPGGLSAAELIAVVWGRAAAGGARWTLAEEALARHASVGALARASDVELAAIPGVGVGQGGAARRRVRARPALRGGLAGGPLDHPVAARRGGPPARGDGPPRARGAAGAQPQREERGPAGVDRVRRATCPRASSAWASCSATPSGSTRAGWSWCTTTRAATPRPSPDDLHLTAEAIAAGRLLDIDVLDHVVDRPRRLGEPPRPRRHASTGRGPRAA